MRDAVTVMWKDWHELFLRKGRPSGSLLAGLALVLVLGAGVPTLMGLMFDPRARGLLGATAVDQALLYMPMMSAFAVLAIVADAMAGERERHTLETLLASPITERNLLVGKIAFVVAYGWILGVIVGPINLLTLTILYGSERVDLPGLDLFLLVALVSGLVSFLVSLLGVLVSARSRSVRQAQQIVSLLLIPIFLVLPSSLIFSQQAWFRNFMRPFEETGEHAGLLMISLFIVGLDLILLFFALRLFRRPKLLLS